MFIVISGGSTTTVHLISMMLKQNHRITIIEEDHETVDNLAEVLPPSVLIIEGDGTDPAIQLDAGVDDADLFIALMGHDETNLVACEIASTAHNVPRCIANVNNPQNYRIFNEVGIESVSSTELIARMVEEEATADDMHTVFSLSEGGIILVEMKLPAAMHHKEGVRAANIPLPAKAQLIAVFRDGQFAIITEDTVLVPGETVIAATESTAEEQFRQTIKHL